MADKIEKITISDLDDFSSDSEKLSPGIFTYGVLLRKTGNAYTAYKFNVNLLEKFFLTTTELQANYDIIADEDGFRNNIEKKLATFCGTDYMEEKRYMLKQDAKLAKKDLPTEETLLTALEKYMTKNDLQICIKKAIAYAKQCASSYSSDMANVGVTAKNAITQANYTETASNMSFVGNLVNTVLASKLKKPEE